jgi:hypothetical protein
VKLPESVFQKKGNSQVKQKILATIIGTALVIAPLPAFTADSSAPAQKTQNSGPLAPGKAAGVQQAQGNGVDDTDILWGAGLVGAVGLGAWALSQNNNNGGGGTTPTPTPSPSTTTSTTP